MSWCLSRAVGRRGLAAVAAVAALGLSACGDGSGAASVTTVQLGSPSYELKPAATTTVVPAVPEPNEEGRSVAEQTYTVQKDEYPFQIAALFDISVDELRNYNGWDEDYSGFPAPGGTVRIPPNAKFVDLSTTTTQAPDSESEDETEDTTEREECTPGTHTLEEGDYPVTVARKYDITLEELLAANSWALDAGGNVPGWPGPGGEVNIPAASDCTTDSTSTTAPAG